VNKSAERRDQDGQESGRRQAGEGESKGGRANGAHRGGASHINSASYKRRLHGSIALPRCAHNRRA